jgi:hypothetical protein
MDINIFSLRCVDLSTEGKPLRPFLENYRGQRRNGKCQRPALRNPIFLFRLANIEDVIYFRIAPSSVKILYTSAGEGSSPAFFPEVAIMPVRLPSPLFLAYSIAAIAIGVLLPGCADIGKMKRQIAELTVENTSLQESRQRLTLELTEQKNTTARLQMALVEKQAEFDRLSRQREIIIPEMEPEFPQGRIPPPNSKAEAVSCLAEAEIEIASIAKPDAEEEKPPVFSQVNDLLAQSRSALDKNDYQNACSLATRALSLGRKLHLQSTLVAPAKTSTYASFLEPLQLQTVKRSNLRARPGSHSRILTTLDAGVPVNASGYRGNWIKVTAGRDQAGWIHHTLLTVPPSGGQADDAAILPDIPQAGDPATELEP